MPWPVGSAKARQASLRPGCHAEGDQLHPRRRLCRRRVEARADRA